MECVRILNPNKYNPEQGQFTRFAFRNTGGGLSVIAWDCIRDTGDAVCAHLRKHYRRFPGVVGETPVYWRFDTAAAFSGAPHTIEPDNSGGDDCHRLVKGIDDEALWKVFEIQECSRFSICDNGTTHSATEQEIIALKTN
jgi:hypothetical protein